MSDRPRILRVPYHGSTLLAILIASYQLAVAGSIDVRTLVLIAGGSTLLYAGLGMRVHDVSRCSGGASKSMHAAMATMLVYLVGGWIAVIAGAVASVAYDLGRRRSPSRLIGNLPTRIIPILATWLTWLGLGGGSMGSMSLPHDYLPLLASALAFAVVNEALFMWDTLSAADLARARWRDELERLPANLRVTGLECLVGAGVAVLCLENPWAAPVALPLAASMYLAHERGNRIQQVTDSALDSFATIVDERDRYTFEHSDRVCEHSMKLGRRLGLTERQLEALYWTSRLHDLGKVAVDNAILNKPSALTPEEFELMKLHPEVSARILASFSFDAYDAEVVRCHHERYDGGGYLRRTSEQVPFEAFIIAVADAFDAMTSDRPYRAAIPEQIALEEIALGLGTQFHPEVGRVFLDLMGFDLGSAIERFSEDDGRERFGAGGDLAREPRVDLGEDSRHAA